LSEHDVVGFSVLVPPNKVISRKNNPVFLNFFELFVTLRFPLGESGDSWTRGLTVWLFGSRPEETTVKFAFANSGPAPAALESVHTVVVGGERNDLSKALKTGVFEIPIRSEPRTAYVGKELGFWFGLFETYCFQKHGKSSQTRLMNAPQRGPELLC
jgi:hypothetical protein